MSQLVRSPCAEGVGLQARVSTPCAEARRPWILASAVAASSMAFIDGSAVTVALPAIRADLGASLAEAQWILNIYVLALAAFTLIGGAAADRFGRRRVYLLSIVAFAVTSLACALAPTAESLIAARAAKGLAGAFLAPASLAIIGVAYPPEIRGRALGVWASASALATSGGPVLGGFLAEQAHWSWVFFLNLPVAVVAIALAWRSLPESRAENAQGALDVVGAVLAAAAFAAIAYALVSYGGEESGAGEAGEGNWPRRILYLGVAGLFAFVLWERRTKNPMMPLSLFASPVFSGVTALTVCLYAGLSAVFFILPFELMEARGWSGTLTGLAFVPFTVAVGVLSRAAGGAVERLGSKLLLSVGAVLAASGFAALGLAPSSWPAGVFLATGLAGLGFALSVAPLTGVALSSAPTDRGGVASGVNNAASRAAGLMGGAAAAAFLASDPDGGFQAALMFAVFTSLAAAVLAAFTIPGRG